MTSRQIPRFAPQQEPITQAFLDEAEQYKLRFCCEDCIFFRPEDGERCLYNYPNATHRSAYFQGEAALGRLLVFCREFEMV